MVKYGSTESRPAPHAHIYRYPRRRRHYPCFAHAPTRFFFRGSASEVTRAPATPPKTRRPRPSNSKGAGATATPSKANTATAPQESPATGRKTPAPQSFQGITAYIFMTTGAGYSGRSTRRATRPTGKGDGGRSGSNPLLQKIQKKRYTRPNPMIL